MISWLIPGVSFWAKFYIRARTILITEMNTVKVQLKTNLWKSELFLKCTCSGCRWIFSLSVWLSGRLALCLLFSLSLCLSLSVSVCLSLFLSLSLSLSLSLFLSRFRNEFEGEWKWFHFDRFDIVAYGTGAKSQLHPTGAIHQRRNWSLTGHVRWLDTDLSVSFAYQTKSIPFHHCGNHIHQYRDVPRFPNFGTLPGPLNHFFATPAKEVNEIQIYNLEVGWGRKECVWEGVGNIR